MQINMYAPEKGELECVELSTDGDVDKFYILPRIGENIVVKSNGYTYYLMVLSVIHHTGEGLGFIDINCEQFEDYADMIEST